MILICGLDKEESDSYVVDIGILALKRDDLLDGLSAGGTNRSDGGADFDLTKKFTEVYRLI